MPDLIHPLVLRAVRAIHRLKSPPPAGSQHYRSGYDDGLEAAIDAVKDAISATPAGLPTAITPPATMPVTMIGMLQVTVADAWSTYGGDPNDAEQFFNHLIGNNATDVPRETSASTEHQHDYTRTIGSWPSGPDGETDSLKACACGAQITVGPGQCST